MHNRKVHSKVLLSGKVFPQIQTAESCRNKISLTMELPARTSNFVFIFMVNERLNTFSSNGWHQGPGTWWPRVLAEAGFYYKGHALEVHCYSCKLKTSLHDWCHKVNEAPSEAHARLNKNCEHVVSNNFIPNPNVPECFHKDDKQAGNSEKCTTFANGGIPAIRKNNSLATAGTHNAVNGYSYEQINLTDIPATDNTSNVVSPDTSDRHQNSIISPRSTPKDKTNSTGSKNGHIIETLNNFSKLHPENQILQTEATGSNSTCLTQINTLSRKEQSFDGNVGSRNLSLSRDSIIKDNLMSNDFRNRDSEHIFNNCNHSIDRAEMDSSYATNSQLTHDGLQSYQPEFRYPQYQTVSARKSSYDKWQFGHTKSPDVLSEAGYFYTGEQDIVRCFCCDLRLAEWDAKDNAWREHAQHNPKCWFLKSQKGESYIKEIQFDRKKVDSQLKPIMSADVNIYRCFQNVPLININRIHECSKVLRWRSSIPTNRKIQIQKCQGDGTRAIPGEIANATQHSEVLIGRPGIQTNRKMHQCQRHGSREVLSEIANVHHLADVIDLRKLSSKTNSDLSLLSEKMLPPRQNAQSRRKNKSTLPFTMELPTQLSTKIKNDIYIHLTYERSNTFKSNGWPQGLGTWWPWVLAEAGFYYRGQDLDVHCYSCKLKTSLRDWCHKVNEVPAEAHARLNRNCEHVVSNNFIPNPNVPEYFQIDDKQAGNSETCATLPNVGIADISKNNSLKATDTPNAVNGYSCEQRNLTGIAATDNAFNAVNGYSREQRNITDIAATANAFNAINGYSREQRNLIDIAEIDITSNAVSGYSRELRNLTNIATTASSSNVTPEISDQHHNSIMSPRSTPKEKNNSIGSRNGYRIETLNNLAKCNTSSQILQKETTDSNNSALPQINTSSRKEPSFDGNVGNGNWSLPQDSILKDNGMNIDVRNRRRNYIFNNFDHAIDRAQTDSSNGMNSQLTQDGVQSYQPEFRFPQYQTLTARKSSYDKWQFGHKQSPDVLSKAGYFYTGEQDIVRCFCCDLGLAEWDAEDNAWREHARHNPKCWFLKSQKGESYIKEIQFDWKKIYNPKHTAFHDKQSRVATFGGWRMDIEQTPDILADAGFFYTGEEDVVRCHYCDGGLHHWEPGDVPWKEHARWFPFCKYVIKMKGREFIDNIKTAREQRERIQNMDTRLSGENGYNGFLKALRDLQINDANLAYAVEKYVKRKENGHNSILKTLRDLQINDDNLAYAIEEYVKRKGNSNFMVEDILDLVHEKEKKPCSNPFAASNFIHEEPPVEKDPETIMEMNRQLKGRMKCISCRNKEICMLFVNCGHRLTCEECSERMDFCPFCDARIKKRLKTFLS